MLVHRLARETKLLAPDLGTSGEPRSVRHGHLARRIVVFVLMGYCGLVGDLHFQAPRRFWTQTTLDFGTVLCLHLQWPRYCVTRICKSESGDARLLDLFRHLADPERRQEDE